jgi:hypothetical protein
MANAIYPKYKEAILQSAANSNMSTGTVRVALVDLGTYTYSAAHEFYSSVTASAVGTPVELTNKTFVNGVFDADDATFTAVTGNSAEALVIYLDTGVAGTSRLIAFQDVGVTGLPVTPNGGNINVVWDNGANRIFAL